MTEQEFLPDLSRRVRDGETVINTEKAALALRALPRIGSETALAERCNISRSVLRRILGKDDGRGWAAVESQNAGRFATTCGVPLSDLLWTGGISTASAEDLASVNFYLDRWVEFRTWRLGPYVPLTIRLGERLTDLTAVKDALGTTAIIQITGPSGSGKSHLLLHLGVLLGAAGYCPIHVRAASFCDTPARWLESAIASFTTLTFDELVNAAKRAKKIPIVLVDAVNETHHDYRNDLIAELQRVQLHHGISIVLTGQTEIALPPALEPKIVTISVPDSEQKKLLVEAHLGKTLFGQDFALTTVTSAHDAMIWASVLAKVASNVSRYTYYSSFVEQRLGTDDIGIHARRVLGTVASQLRRSFSYSLPATAVLHSVERITPSGVDIAAIYRRIQDADLLPVADGIASFRHEIFQNFFSTEALIASNSNAQSLVQSLLLPLNLELQEFAIGSLSSSADIQAGIVALSSAEIVGVCLLGRCGEEARKTAKDMCVAAILRLQALMCGTVFDRGEIDRSTGRYGPLVVNMTDSVRFESFDRILVGAAAIFYDEDILDCLLRMFSTIDAHIETERQRLLVRYPDTRIAWRQRMFQELYTHPTAVGLWPLQQLFQGRKVSWFHGDGRDTNILERLKSPTQLTNGQLYFLIEELQHIRVDELPPSLLYSLVEHAWKTGIYIVRIVTCHMLAFQTRHLDEQDRERLSELANSWLSDDNFMLNSSVIDVLKSLGAIEDQFSAEQAVKEFEDVLLAKPDSLNCERAFTLYGYMTDHPFDSDYCEAFYSLLSEQQRSDLRSRAIRTTSTNSMTYSFLLSEVAKYPTNDMVPILQCAATAPNPDTMSVQESVCSFVSSCHALAMLGAPLQDISSAGSIAQSWRNAASILLCFFAPEQTAEGYEESSKADWQALIDAGAIDIPMRILRENFRQNSVGDWTLAEWSRVPLLKMARAFLDGKVPQASVFKEWPHDRLHERYTAFALEIVGLFGNRSDLPTLSRFADNFIYGRDAISAARKIEGR